MIEGQVVGRMIVAAVLAGELVAQEYVEPGEGGAIGDGNILLQRNDGRQVERPAGRMDLAIIFRQYVHAVEKHRLDGVLPGP